MSATAESITGTVVSGSPMGRRKPKMSKRRKIGYAVLGVYILGMVFFGVVYGVKSHKNASFDVISPYHLVSWGKIVGPIDFNKGVFYVIITAILTVGVTMWVAWKMQKRPGRLQVAVEWMYDISAKMTNDNMKPEDAKKWFPLVFTLFVFIAIANLIGYIPLPVDTESTFKVFGVNVPAFQIYTAVTNVALPMVLSLGVSIAYNFEGFRHHGFIGYLKSLVPAGVSGPMLVMMYPLEFLSHFLRLLSLTIRLWANLLAGHLLIDFMAGDLAVLLGLQLLGWFTLPAAIAIYLFEATLIAILQAFIFAILTAIYLGGALSDSH